MFKKNLNAKNLKIQYFVKPQKPTKKLQNQF